MGALAVRAAEPLRPASGFLTHESKEAAVTQDFKSWAREVLTRERKEAVEAGRVSDLRMWSPHNPTPLPKPILAATCSPTVPIVAALSPGRSDRDHTSV